MITTPTQLDPISLRPTIMDIDLDALVENYRAIRALVKPARVMAVVKANAYGHGLVTCAKRLEREGVDYLGVALLEEGLTLRQHGITAPIHVFGGIVGGQVGFFLDYDLDVTASSVAKLEAIDREARTRGKRARAQLKIDTGMERVGVHYYSAGSLFEAVTRCDFTEIAGIFSHFATSTDVDPTFAREQIARFNSVLVDYQRITGRDLPARHLANSAGLLKFPESRFDMVRPGIILYGIMPDDHLRGTVSLRPVMSLRSQVVYFKVVKKGHGVSYGLTWVAPEDSRVVTVPIGYGDGLPRSLSNVGEVLIRGKRYPMVGKICMDQVMVNIARGEAYNDDEVVVVGTQGSETISVEDIARLAEVIPYEILVSLNLRLPRRYRDGSAQYYEKQ